MLFTTDMLALLNKHFFVSLTLADLCVGLFVTPFSVWTTVFDRWIYGDRFCHVEAYLAAILYIASVYNNNNYYYYYYYYQLTVLYTSRPSTRWPGSASTSTSLCASRTVTPVL